jgi:hypothetical protein
VVINLRAHQHDVIPPNVRTTDPLTARGVHIHAGTQGRRVHRSLALAAGFGGATAAISIISL